MRLATTARTLTLTLAALAVAAFAFASAIVKEEHVTGGNLDLPWLNGFGVSANMTAQTLTPDHPAYANPSGDHTVANATNMQPDSGGVILTATDPMGLVNYSWEANWFTGDGNTRRGLAVRADPNNGFESSYQLVVQSGLFSIAFRKVIDSAPTTLRSYNASQLPAGSLPPNTWHTMKITAQGPAFRCYIDGFELTSIDGPIIDADLPTGWPGVYNFRFDLGGVPFLTDDLKLTELEATPAQQASWGTVKQKWAK